MSKEDQIVDSINTFSIELFKKLAVQGTDSNILISPLSAAITLYSLLEGAEGKTKDQIEKTLGVSLIQSGLKIYIKYLLESFNKSDSSTQLKITNSIWLNSTNNINLFQRFLTTVKSYYKNTVSEVDFNDPDTVKNINNWAKENTNGNISSMLSELSPSQTVLLINAIYFKSNWSTAFNPNYTEDDTFYLANGTEKQVPFMIQEETHNYFQNSQVEILRLDYGEKDTLNAFMYLFLPSENSSLEDLYKNLKENVLSDWLSDLAPYKVYLEMPKFKAEYSTNLSSPLRQSMPDAFGDNADFSGITEKQISITDILHKTSIAIDEEGSRISAVTSVTFSTMGVSRKPLIPCANMKLNKPFFYVIVDSKSGVILFTGQVTDPQS